MPEYSREQFALVFPSPKVVPSSAFPVFYVCDKHWHSFRLLVVRVLESWNSDVFRRKFHCRKFPLSCVHLAIIQLSKR